MTALLLTALLILGQEQSVLPGTLRQNTEAITRGATSLERRTAITDSLRTAGVTFEVQEFTQGTRVGANVIVTLPSKDTGSGSVLLGAHLDRVARGQGAVDNAASCAILLEIARRLKVQPLQKTTVIVAFFDLEENGLLGSAAFFQQSTSSARPNAALNLDIFGYGDTLFVATSKDDSPLLATFEKAASEYGKVPAGY